MGSIQPRRMHYAKVHRSLIGRVSLARENEAGAVGDRKSIFSMLTYRNLFCFWL